ncbi:endonuclease/exonuclease/phosphatase family protein [Reinekea sp.]|jgi:endonuclease/exonuclease/phosphatase family metal-dependent hydrolase|uniref:endonuclease/exonuclease/phosphatase family protein n=1 Tax=Reinekea sp. TaxID=1970455 RepID=UPI002A834EC6|nr:endonuclease/exonuclease/phosphatase family protein [Reinekea sp.]
MSLPGFGKTALPVLLEPWHQFMRPDPLETRNTLKLLSYNIQVGIQTRHYPDYLIKAWQHVWPAGRREHNLQQIAEMIRHYDIIALQEVDGGSFRTQYVNQIHYLAKAAHKEYWHQQLNRNLGRLGQHSNAVIGNIRPLNINDHPLPGRKGRGAIAFEVGELNPLIVVMAHLALGRRDQDEQLKYIGGLIGRYRSAVVMGDMNTDSLRILNDSPLKNVGLKAAHARATYPSWRPTKCFDQILVSQHINITKMGVLDFALSDHLPVAIEIEIPE